MKTITIKSLKGRSFIINPALITYIEQSDFLTVKINFLGGNLLRFSTQEWKSGYDTSELESDDIDIAEYKKFLSELEAA